MKTAVTALCFMLAAAPAFAQAQSGNADRKATPSAEGAKKAPTGKQLRRHARFKGCSERAHERKGGERRDLISGCLRGGQLASAESSAPKPQHAKMKGCSQEAAQQSLKGEARKRFMKPCLSA